MSCYYFFDILDIKDPAKMESYRESVLATVDQFGGRYLAVGGLNERIEGNYTPIYPVVIEFPNYTNAKNWYNSVEYQPLKQLRHEATLSNAFLVDGL